VRQLVGLIVVAAIGVGAYLYFFKPEKFKEVQQRTMPDMEMTALDHYRRGDVRFNANKWQEAIDDYKKAMKKDMKETGKDRPKALHAAQAMYRIASAYDNMAKGDSSNPKKGEWEQQAANWFKRFLKYYEGHKKYGARAERKLQELESTGIKASAEMAD